MNDLSKLAADHEPAVETIELLCDQLADLGLAVAPDTARDLIRTVLTAEAPRLDARWRGMLGASLDTIRIAAQAALGMLNTAAGPEPAPHVRSPAAAPAVVVAPPRAVPAPTPAVAPPARPAARTSVPTPTPPSDSRRPIARRGPRRPSREEPLPSPPLPADRRADIPDADEPGEHRPVFKRPRGR